MVKFNVVILCGGKATRMGDICKSIPKSLLKINGRTILSRQISMLPLEYISEVVLASDHLRDKILEWNKNKYIVARYNEVPGGTAGAIARSLIEFTDMNLPIIVLNGDVLFNQSLKEIVEYYLDTNVENLIMGCGLYPLSEYGELVTEFDFDKELNKVIAFNEKRDTTNLGVINGGVYILNPNIFREFGLTYNTLKDRPFSIEREIFPQLATQNRLHTFITNQPWSDLGTPERLYNAGSIFI